MASAKIILTGEIVTGIWQCDFDEWVLVDENGNHHVAWSLTELDHYPWLPYDHFCQPKKGDKKDAN
jgi:hypothetical protein